MVSPSPAWRGRSVVVARLFPSFPKKTAALPSRRLYFGPTWPEVLSAYKEPAQSRFSAVQRSDQRTSYRLQAIRRKQESNPEREEKLRKYTTGWINCYRYADMKNLMEVTDEWLRHRIRAVYWRQWKRVRTRYKIFRALQLPEWQVHKMANCRKGTWRAAEMLNSVLTKTIIVDRLGYPSMTAHYLKVRVNY